MKLSKTKVTPLIMDLPLEPPKQEIKLLPVEPDVLKHKKYTKNEVSMATLDGKFGHLDTLSLKEMKKLPAGTKLWLIQGNKMYGYWWSGDLVKGAYNGEPRVSGCSMVKYTMGVLAK